MKTSSIRTRLILVGVLCTVLSTFAIALINYLALVEGAHRSINRYGQAVGKSNAQPVATWVADNKRAVAEMARAAPLATDIAATMGMLQRAAGVELAYVGMADKSFHRGTPRTMPADYDPTARPWYKLAADASAPVLTTPYIDASTKELVVTFAAPIKEGGQLKGVAGADVSLKGIADLVRSIRPFADSYALLVDREGRMIVSYEPADTMKNIAEWSPLLSTAVLAKATEKGEMIELANVHGRPAFVAAAAVAGTPWWLVLVMDRQETLGNTNAITLVSVTGALLVSLAAALVISLVVSRITRRLKDVQNGMDEVGSGHADLSKRLSEAGNDELSKVGQSFNRFVGVLSDAFGRVRQSSESVRVAAGEIAAGNQDLSERTEQTATSIQSAAARINSLSEAVRQSADSARQADSMTGDAAATAERGGQVVREVVNTMNNINESSRKIADIVGVIDGIAFQTNILALNAAVEAARAGEQGRGFAVVASEVRHLAQRSASAAKEIKQLIDESVSRVETGAVQVGRAGTTMDEIVQAVQVMSATVKEISQSAEAQRRDIDLITHEMNQLDQVTQQNAALVEQSAAAASSLREEADRLGHVLDGFKT